MRGVVFEGRHTPAEEHDAPCHFPEAPAHDAASKDIMWPPPPSKRTTVYK